MDSPAAICAARKLDMGCLDMGLEEHYLGDQAFAEFSEAFEEEWKSFPQKEELLKIVGSIELARPVAFYCRSNFSQWLQAKIPAIDYMTPLECLSSSTGVRRLKSCLMRMG